MSNLVNKCNGVGRICTYIRRHPITIAFLMLLIIASFFRFYHFSEWLHFELDQARDAVVVHSALRDGFSTLPLLGPQARGGGVFLGPVFYYFQYLAGLVLGPSPESFAVPDLLFSVGGIVVLFCLLRRFLRVPEAAAVSLLASVSVFLVNVWPIRVESERDVLLLTAAWIRVASSGRTDLPASGGGARPVSLSACL